MRHMILKLAAAAAAASLSTIAVAGAAQAQATAPAAIKNVVLVHGAFADGSGWRNAGRSGRARLRDNKKDQGRRSPVDAAVAGARR